MRPSGGASGSGDPPTVAGSPDSRLARRLGTADAVVVGLGAMIGAGVFVAIAPAAAVAGSGLLLGLAVAAVVAWCNATSSARLAAVHPRAGGAYAYGRRELGPLWGYLAGWGFVIGKTASCTAMALTFGAYAWPDHPRVPALVAVAALVVVNLAGVTKSVTLTKALLVVVLGALAVVVAAAWSGGTVDADNLGPVLTTDPLDVLRSAGLLFFSFAGYARIATLGEEVRDPARTIPRAVPIALGFTVAVYVVVAASALLAVGPDVLASSRSPLAEVVRAGDWHDAAVVVRVGAAVASVGVLLSLLLGVSRTVFAMADERDLPHALAAVHPRTRVPHVAEAAVGAVVFVVVAFADLRDAIGFSSFAVLVYYAIANASALALRGERAERPGARHRAGTPVAALGLVGCVTLALTLPGRSVVAGAIVFAAGLVVHLSQRLVRRRG